jgi:hypothetical protein
MKNPKPQFDEKQRKLTDFIVLELASQKDTIKDTIEHPPTPTIESRPAMDTLISDTITKETIQQALTQEKKVRLMSIHKLPYVYSYEGTQPTRDASSIRRIGRYGSGRQVYYWWSEEMAGIQVFKRKLMIWVKKPKGMAIDDQLGEAKDRANAIARKFAMKYGLGNLIPTSEPPTERTPDVIIEDKSVAKVLKPIVKDGLIEGMGINQTSHKGKVETDWNKGKQLEFLLSGGLEVRFERLEAKIDVVGGVLNRIAGIFEKLFSGTEGGGNIPVKPLEKDDLGMYR